MSWLFYVVYGMTLGVAVVVAIKSAAALYQFSQVDFNAVSESHQAAVKQWLVVVLTTAIVIIVGGGGRLIIQSLLV